MPRSLPLLALAFALARRLNLPLWLLPPIALATLITGFQLDSGPLIDLGSYGLWLTLAAALRDPRLSSEWSKKASLPGVSARHRVQPDLSDPFVRAQQVVLQSFNMKDPPDHTRLRNLVHKAFTPRLIERLRGGGFSVGGRGVPLGLGGTMKVHDFFVNQKIPRAERDRIGEIVFRFFLGCLYRHRQFSGDPHPGNFRVTPDGRLGVLDFGKVVANGTPSEIAQDPVVQEIYLGS